MESSSRPTPRRAPGAPEGSDAHGAPEVSVGWPLSRDQHELLVMLATMIRRFGPERFTEARLVRADREDFPGAWEPTLAAVQTLLYRLCWHAHIDPEIAVEDRRPAKPADHRMLRTSEIELATCGAGVVTFHVAAIGNDDVAGLLAHKLGQAFLELAPDDPFRTTTREADEREGSVAAVFLGLGVLVANAAMYRRHASKVVGREEYSEQYIAKVGGLSIVDATLLVALQDIVRDDYQDALTTLHGPQRDWVEQWKAVLDPHEAELRELLGLDAERDPITLTRPAQPRTPPAMVEPDLRKFNRGGVTFRVKDRTFAPMVLGACVGAVFFVAPYGVIVGPAVIALLGYLGWRQSKPYFVCTDPPCGRHMASEVDTCPGCGGAIVETLAHANLRLDRLDELVAEGKLPAEPDLDYSS